MTRQEKARRACRFREAELWEPIQGSAYAISSMGNVWSFKSGRMLKGKMQRGYRRVHLSFHDGNRWVAVHRLVAEAFVPGKTAVRWSVNHINGDKADNRSSNLQWCSSDDQNRHATEAGLRPIGEGVGSAKLTDKDALEIYRARESGVTQENLATLYGVSQSQISSIWTGRTWGWVTNAVYHSTSRDVWDHIPESIDGCRWKKIPGCRGYFVSDSGLVWSSKSNRLLQTHRPNHRGYVAVNLCSGGVTKKHLVHRLVAEAFVPGRSGEQWSVNHLDMDKMNNHYSNLEWASDDDQQRHKTRMMAGRGVGSA